MKRILVKGMLLAMCSGCTLGIRQDAIVGTWECTDLTAVEHVSQFAKDTMIIQADGSYVAFLTDHDGSEQPQEHGRYKIKGDRITFDDEEPLYRFTVTGDRLVLTVAHSQNKEDVGRSLTFQRRDHSDLK